MALEVASLLDGVSSGKDYLSKAVSGMNTALNLKKVNVDTKEKCSVIVSIGKRSYLFSTVNGVMQVGALENGEELTKAIAKSDSRLFIDPEAFNKEAFDGEAWEEALKERRKMYLEGDPAKYARVHNALLTHVSALSASIPAAAKTAQHKAAASIKELEPPELQVAHLAPDAETPPLQHCAGWLLFSALSSFNGNMGQSNYVAANMFMDQMTFWHRQTLAMGPSVFEPLTTMWGTVGHMGMRWKAFGSADMIYADPNSADIVMMPADAQLVLKCIFGIPGEFPEWFCNNTFDKMTVDFYKAGGMPPMPAPWNKAGQAAMFGKGGGSAPCQKGDIFESLHTIEKNDANVGSGKIGQEGRRVRLHGLAKNSEMNGKKGTLLQETEDGNWVVRLDADLGDKVVKLDNLMTLSGTKLK